MHAYAATLQMTSDYILDKIYALDQCKNYVLFTNIFFEKFELVLIDVHGLCQIPTLITEWLNNSRNDVCSK